MNCRIEEIDTFGRKLHIDIPAEAFNERLDAKLRKLSITAKIKGFRPGKAPPQIIKRYYGAEAKADVANTLMYENYREVLMQHDFYILCKPSFEDIEIDDDKGIAYTVYVEVLPDLQLNTYEDITIEKPVCEITEKDVDVMVERVRKDYATWQVKDGPACIGDRVTIGINVMVTDEKSVELLKDKSYVLGSRAMSEHFDKQIENMCADEKKEVTLGENINPKTTDSDKTDMRYEVCLKSVEAAILPELDDDFFKACNIQEGGLDALRASLREGMEWELKRKLSQLYHSNVENVMLSHGNIKAPPAMMEERLEKMKKIMAGDNEAYADKDISDELLEKVAKRAVCLNILFMYISRKNDFKADRNRCETKINELAEGYKDPERIKNYYRSDADAYRRVESLVLEDKVIDYVIEKTNLSEKEYPFYELIDMEKTQ